MAYVPRSGGGRSWQRIVDPPTGNIAGSSSLSADSFSGGLTVDVSSYVPAGTVAVKIAIFQSGTQSRVYVRPDGDTNVSNTPNASNENHCRVMNVGDDVFWGEVRLSSDYKFQIAVSGGATNINVAVPSEVLL